MKLFSQPLNTHRVNDVRQTKIHTAEPLEPEPSAFEFQLAIEKVKNRKSPDIDQISEELIKTWCRTNRPETYKLIISIFNKEELPGEWNESIIVRNSKKGDKANCSNYRVMSLLPTTYKIVYNILLSRLTPYAEEIFGDRQCGF